MIVDKVKVPVQPIKETITTTQVNPTTGIMTTFTNDIKVMKEDKTFANIVTYLEKNYKVTELGYEIQSESISRLQRVSEHHIRYLKGDVAYDFRINADERTGIVTLLENHQHTVDLSQQISLESFETSPLVISETELVSAIHQYPIIDSAQHVIEQADFQLKGQ